MKTKPELRMDPAKLRTMKEPFIVRVEKMRGSSRMPIELPSRGDGLSGGEGWDRDSISKLDTWLATEWSGGGVYRIVIVDQDGERMEWESVFDPRQFPEITPPTMTSMALPLPHPSTVAAQQQVGANGNGGGSPAQPSGPSYGSWPPPAWTQRPSMAQPYQNNPQQTANTPTGQVIYPPPSGQQPNQNQNPNGNANGNGQYQSPSNGSYTPPGYGPPPGYNSNYPPNSNPNNRRYMSSRYPWGPSPEDYAVAGPNGWGPPGWTPPVAPVAAPILAGSNPALEAERQKLEIARQQAEADKKALQDQLAKMERDRLERDYHSQVEKQNLQHQQQMQALQEEIRRMAEKPVPVPTGPSPEAEQLKLERERFERERERAREQEAINERFRQLQESMAAQAAAAREALAAQAQQSKEAMAATLNAINNSNANKPTGPDPVLTALQAQVQAQAEESRRERERLSAENLRERERQEADRRLQEIKEENRRREDDFRRQMELLQANSNKGPDQTIMLMQQQMSHQVEAMKDIARQQQTSFDRMSGLMMAPRDVIALVKDQGSGLDDLRKTLSSTYTDIFNTQKMVVEHAMQLAGGGGPSLGERVLEQGLSRAGELAERYLAVQRDKSVGESKARQAQAEAMARMAQAQAGQMPINPQAQMRTSYQPQAQAQQPIQQPPAGYQQPGYAPAGQIARPAQPQPQYQGQPQAAPSSGLGDAAAPVPNMGKVIQMRRLGHTDEEWFSQAVGEVKKLRTGVNEFLKSIGADPPRLNEETGEPIGYSPAQCAHFLIIGANRISGLGLEVKAFTDLFAQERFADFVDIVLPDAPQPFRDDVVEALIKEIKGDLPENTMPESSSDQGE